MSFALASQRSYDKNRNQSFRELYMKQLVGGLLLSAVGIVFAASSLQAAADLAQGEKVFKANCAMCHAGGRNTVNPAKTLKIEDLKKYKMDTAAAISAQLYNGKGAMPAFGKNGKLKQDQIDSVTAYVLDQANKGWKK
nr:c-type cytochrome [Gloeobacter violaceus]